MAYTNIDDPSAYFQVKLWTGTGAAGNTITLDGNSDMQPDFMWHKEPTDTNGWHQMDSSRGTTYILASQSTGAEYDVLNTYISSFNSNGFTAGYGDSSINSNGVSQCSWMWHCNNGTTSSNTDGDITSTVQVNSDAGFSIVTYTGESAARLVGHGLGVKPDMLIFKNRDSASNWYVFHKDLSNYTTYAVLLNGDNPQGIYSNAMAGVEPTSSTFAVGNDVVTGNSDNHICYAFASKQGYSKFGKYVGNGNANGPFIYTGFKPAFFLLKKTSAADGWRLFDNKRAGYNDDNYRLAPDDATAEDTATTYLDILSNGVKIRGTAGSFNQSGGTYIFMAFAENPFVTSTGIPTTAR